jgi:hypothetical protein
VNNKALLLGALAGLCCAAGIVAACGDFASNTGEAQPVTDAAPLDALVAADAAAGPDAAPQADAAIVLDAGSPLCGESPVFASNFDGNSLEEGWSQVLNGQFPVEGGKPDGSASLRSLTSQSFTTPPNALALGLTTTPEVSGAGSGLMKEVPWKGKCLDVRFDFNVPADARGYAIAFSVAPWKNKRYLSFTIDSGTNTSAPPKLTVWQDGPLDDGAAPIGNVTLARAVWYRAEVRVSPANQELGRYEVILTALPSSTQSAPQLASWDVQTQAKVAVDPTAQVKLELFGIVAEQRIWFDTVSVFAR